MAKCTFATPYDRVHGRLAGSSGNGGQVLFSSPHGGNVVRGWVRPRNAQTVTQEANRARMTTIGKAYRDLTAAQAAAWRAAAAQIAKTNPLGLSYVLSGIGLYSAVNMFRLFAPVILTSDPPSDLTLPPRLLSLDHVGYETDPMLTIKISTPGLSFTGKAACRLSPPLHGQAVQTIPQHCRFGLEPLSNNITNLSAGSASFDYHPPSSHFSWASRVGAFLTPLTSEYLPGPSSLFGNFPVSVSISSLEMSYSFNVNTVSGAPGSESIMDLGPWDLTGTSHGPIWQPSQGLAGGGAFDFDGNQAYIAFSRITIADAMPWSCGAWVHSDSGANFQIIFGDRADHDGWFGLHGVDDLTFISVSGAQVSKQLSSAYSGRTFHAVLTCDGDKVWFFENGSPLGSMDPATTDIAPNGLGVKSLGAGEGFNGLMDEPFFFSRQLSADEVAALYSQGPMFPNRVIV